MQESRARRVAEWGMIVLHDRPHAGAGYRRCRLPDDRILNETFQTTEIGVDMHRDHRLTRSLDLDLYAEQSGEIRRRLRKARYTPAHVRPAIDLLGIATAHLTGPAFLS